MMRYRFPLLLAICIGYLGFAPDELGLTKLKIADSKTLILSTQKANAQDSSASTEQTEDPYAQKAPSHFESYLAQKNNSSNPSSKNNFTLFGSNSIWLIIGLGFLTLAFLGGMIALITQFNKKSKSIKFNSDNSQDFSFTKNEEKPLFSQNFSNNSRDNFSEEKTKNHSKSEPDFSLPVQPTTRIPSIDLIEELIKTLRDPDTKNRRKSIWKLAQVSDSRAMKPLVDLMIETDSYERSLILEALSQVCSRTLRPMNQALAISLQDKNSQVRKNAIRDLTRLYDLMSQINELLCYALDDENQEVQETAKWALEKLNMRMPVRINLNNQKQNGEPIFEEDIEEDHEDEEEDSEYFKR